MKAGIMQPYFFPYISYFQLIDAVDVFVIYDYVTFRKKSWITRNRIYDKSKKEPVFINLPVLGSSSNKLIHELEINNNSDWKKKTLNLIYFNYKKASFFEEIYPFIESLLHREIKDLHTFNSETIIEICKLLKIETKIVYKNSAALEVERQIQPQLLKDSENSMSERVVKLCEFHNTDTYINPIGGTELYFDEYFKRKELDLFFIETGEIEYVQFTKDYVPYLSIVDMLMHIGVEGTAEMIKKYKLIKNDKAKI